MNTPSTEKNLPSLSIQDLKVAADIINICTQRGAFRANELSSVGTLFDRLSAFLAAVDVPDAEPVIGSEPSQGEEN